MSWDQQIPIKEENCLMDIDPLKTERSSDDSLENDTQKYDLEHEEIVEDIKIEIEEEKASRILYTCDECFEKFEYIEQLEAHKTIHEPFVKTRKNTSKRCLFCRLQFKSIALYAPHLQQHITNYEQCIFCPKIFFKRGAFSKHVAQHKQNGELACSYCGKQFTIPKSLKIHIRVHTNERPYSCHHCGKSFKQMGSLTCHRNTIHNEGEPEECSICLGKFSTKSSLKRHIKKIHKNGKIQVHATCQRGLIKKDGQKERNLEDCLASAELPKEPQDHVDRYNKESGRKTEEAVLKTSLPQSHGLEDDNNRKVTCWLCGEEVLHGTYANHKNDHMLLSVEELSDFSRIGCYPCKKCDNEYPTENLLFRHMDSHMQKQYECDKGCGGESGFTYAGLMRHLQKCHSLSTTEHVKEKLSPCKLCGAMISRLAYENHRNKHINMSVEELKNCKTAGKYPCKQCNVTVVTRQKLLEHIKCHLPKIYTCPQGCQIGVTKFTYVRLKAHHFLQHKLFVCEHCKKSYNGVTKLKSHWRNEKCKAKNGYICKWCNASYISSVGLLTHYKKHTSGPGYQCGLCKQRFMRPFGLKMHMSSVHEKNVSLQACSKATTNENSLTCRWCKVTFISRERLESHENLHKPKHHECKYCKSRFSKSANYFKHIKRKTCIKKWTFEALIPDTKDLMCYFCKKTFGGLDLVKKHLMTHMKQPYPCMFCASSVPLESLRKHLIKKHPNEKKYFCMGCEASFIKLNEYVEHRKCFKRNLLSHRDQIPNTHLMPNEVTVNQAQSPVIPDVLQDATSNVIARGNIKVDDFIDVPEIVHIDDYGEVVTDPLGL